MNNKPKLETMVDALHDVTAYLDQLRRLGLPPTDPNTAIALGVTLRQVQRYASGATRPPRTVTLLLQAYLANPTLLDIMLKLGKTAEA